MHVSWTIPRLTAVALLVLPILAVGGGSAPALAQCSPGQLQEANLAYNTAKQFIDAQQYAQAIPRLQSILEMCPEHVFSWRGLGVAYSKLEQFEQSKQAFEKVIEVGGDQVVASDFAELGKVYARLGDYPNAIIAYSRAHVIEPDNCAILINLGIMQGAAKDYRKSVDTLEEALEGCPSNAELVKKQLANFCKAGAAAERQRGNTEMAAVMDAKYQQYATGAGGSTAYDLVRQLMQQEKYGEAATKLEQMLTEDPQRSSWILTLARCYGAIDQHGREATAYERYLALSPEDYDATGALVYALVQDGQLDRAISVAQSGEAKFRAMGRKYLAHIMYGWGKALEAKGDYQVAKEKFEFVRTSGDSKWSPYGTSESERMDQYLERERARTRNQGN